MRNGLDYLTRIMYFMIGRWQYESLYEKHYDKEKIYMLSFRKDTPNINLEVGIPTKISWKTRNGKFSIGTIDASTIALFAFLTGWFIYGGLQPALALLAFAIIVTITSIVGIIPFAGPALYWFLAKKYVITMAIHWVANISDTVTAETAVKWPFDVIFYIGFANAVLATIVAIFLIYRKLSDRADAYQRKNP